MRKTIRYNILGVGAAMALALCSCEAESPVMVDETPSSTSKSFAIEIMGGKPDGLSLDSRAVSEPSKFGKCYADELQLWIYRGDATRTYNSPGIDQMEFKNLIKGISITRYSADNKVDKLTTYLYDAIDTRYYQAGYVFPAIAYTKEDYGNESKFSLIGDGAEEWGKGIKNIGIKMNGLTTPELYFGNLKMASPNKSNDFTYSGNITLLPNNSGINEKNYTDCPIYGKLYRIVSQLNVNVTEVDVENVESMEMYLSNLPTSLTLYGNHGAFYKVKSADESQHLTAMTLVATTSDFPKVNGVYTATLSTFLLPSRLGRHLTVRLKYKPGTLTDKDGHPLKDESQYQDFEIRPTKSFYLTGEDAEVYTEGVSYAENGKDLCIYNHLKDEFYSYSNVKVNISGKFDKVFVENQDVNVSIEVCPSFEASHPFEF